MVRQNMRHTIIHPRSVNGSSAPQYSTEAHIPHLHARDTQMGNTPVPCTRALDKLRCNSRSAPFRGPRLCQISKHRLLETLFLPYILSHCWAYRGPPEPGEWRPGGGIPSTPQILRKLLAPAIVQFDDHGKILRVFSNPFPKSRAHANVRTHRVRTQTNAEVAHKGRVWGVVLRQRKAPVRTAQPRVVSSAPAKTTLADRLLQGPLLAAQQLRTRPQLVARHAHIGQPRRRLTASFAARGRRG